MYKSFAVVRDICDEWLDLFKVHGEGVRLECTLRTDGSVSTKVCVPTCASLSLERKFVVLREKQFKERVCLFAAQWEGEGSTQFSDLRDLAWHSAIFPVKVTCGCDVGEVSQSPDTWLTNLLIIRHTRVLGILSSLINRIILLEYSMLVSPK